MKTLLFDFYLVALVLSSHSSSDGYGYGLQVSQPTQISGFYTFKANAYTSIVIRGLTSYGEVDIFAESNLKNARFYDFKTDIYMFPCRSKTVNSQVDEMMKKIPQNLYTRVWIKVIANPTDSCSWSGSHIINNCQYIQNIIKRIKSKGKQVGIYTSREMWQMIIGSQSGCPQIAEQAKLSYFHYDKVFSFDDFVPFGGWSKPFMKQPSGEYNLQGYLIDGFNLLDQDSEEIQ